MNCRAFTFVALMGMGLVGPGQPSEPAPPPESFPPSESSAPPETHRSSEPRVSPDYPRPAPPLRPHVRAAQIYKMSCASCHGVTGGGDGPISHLLHSRPRNFTQAEFKLRSTPSGYLPTEQDLARTIQKGLPGTQMRGFDDHLSASEIEAVVQVLRRFSGRFDKEPVGPRVPIPPMPPVTAERLARGRVAFEKYSCTGCHGPQGRGNGPWAKLCLDRDGRPAPPRDFTLPDQMRSGPEPQDLYRTLLTGLDGTPMIALGILIDPDELWSLVYFVRSIAHQPSMDLAPLPGGE